MAALLSLTAFQLTMRVAEPEGPARCLPLLANGVTDQGLGEVTSEARNGAGNAVLAEVCPHENYNQDLVIILPTQEIQTSAFHHTDY